MIVATFNPVLPIQTIHKIAKANSFVGLIGANLRASQPDVSST